MIKCIALDDEPLALQQIISYIEKVPELKLLKGFPSALKAMDFVRKNQVDLMFVDIQMPDLSGMEFVKSLVNPPKVIFTTAYREFAAEGFEMDAADYLVKPISFSAFSKSVEKIFSRYFDKNDQVVDIQRKEQFLFIKTEYRIVRINLNEIKYIEGMRDYIRVHLVNENPIMSLLNMGKIMENLPAEQFMRVHRSYIVNLDKIHTVERNRIVFDGNVYIPVSNQYKDDFQNFLDTHFLK